MTMKPPAERLPDDFRPIEAMQSCNKIHLVERLFIYSNLQIFQIDAVYGYIH